MRHPATAPVLLEDATALDLLRELVAGQQQIIRLLDRHQRPASADDGRSSRLLCALADAMGDLDLAFDAQEVIAHAAVHHGLDAALLACGARTTAALGALLRSLRDCPVDGLTIVRDGRSWRLVRT